MDSVLIGSILTALGVNALCFLLFGFVNRKKVALYGFSTYLLFTAFSVYTSFLLLHCTAVLLQYVSGSEESIYSTSLVLFMLMAFLCALLFISLFFTRGAKKRNTEEKNFALLKSCGVAAGILLLCEIFVFNYLSFVPLVTGLQPSQLTLESAELKDAAQRSGGAILIGQGGGSVTFSHVDARTCCFKIHAVNTDKNPFNEKAEYTLDHVSVDLTDENFETEFYRSGSYTFYPDTERSTVLPVYSSGKMDKVKFTFDSSCEGMILFGISVNQPGFSFSFLRFFCISSAVLLFIIIKRKRLWAVVYRQSSIKHNLLVAALIVTFCFLSLFIGRMPGFNDDIAYPLKDTPENYGCYVQQFDAFQKGQLNLDIKVDPQLAAVSNPYDFGQMHEKVPYSWDRAFYNGKYYSYFGLAPLLVAYYPYYYITGALPSDLTAATILTFLALPLLLLLVRQVACRFCKNINFLLLLLCMTAVPFANLLFVLQVSADFYYIPYISSLLFSSLFLLAALKAEQAQSGRGKAAYLLLSAVSFVLMVGSRPITALTVVLVIPAFLKRLTRKGLAVKKKIAYTSVFAVPILAGAALMMLYNYNRFGNPLEFGLNYQLTVDNPRFNTVSVLNILPAIYYYIFQLPKIDPQFPFVHVTHGAFNYYPSYKLQIPMMGIMSFPFMWSLFAAPKSRFCKGAKYNRILCILVLVCAAGISVFDFSASGTLLRYVTDITLCTSLLATVVLLNADVSMVQQNFAGQGNPALIKMKKQRYACIAIALLLSVAVGAAAVFDNERNFIQTYAPWVYADLSRLCMFW